MKKLLALCLLIAFIGVSIFVRVANSNINKDEQAADSEATNVEESGDGSDSRPFLEYSAATDNIEPEGEPIPVTAKLLKHGEWVFRGMCIGCHGPEGDGNGAVWELADKYAPQHKLPRKPRDFTEAVYKIRSTPSGSLPTDVDLFKSISRGLVAEQDMPAFKYLPERDRWAVIAYIKSLSDIWVEEAEYQEDPIEVGESPAPDEAMIAAGKDVYKSMKCAKCHGELGKGDGPSAPDLEDDNGLTIIPRDFSDASQFVGASDPKGVFQTFNTGLDGTPMPSFLDFLDEEQSWQLVWYVMSLRTDFDLQAMRQQIMHERGEEMIAMVGSGSGAAVTTATEATGEAEVEEMQPDAEDSSEAAETEESAEATQTESEGEAAEVAKTAEETDSEQNQQQPTDSSAEESSESEQTQLAAESDDSEKETVVASNTAASDSEQSASDSESGRVGKFLGKYEEIELEGGGSITGTVVYNGSVKKRTVLPTKDKDICGKTRKVPLVLVGEDGAVQDSVVYLKGVEQGKAWPESALQVPVLDQKNCEFQPHIQVGRQGDLDIINSDPVLHNTHGYYGTRTAFNVALPEKDQKVTKVMKRPGTVKVDCDAHGWMLAWVQVVDNPYYFQTGEDGQFNIENVPAGDYTLTVWQEWLGETEFNVTVAQGETTELDVELKK